LNRKIIFWSSVEPGIFMTGTIDSMLSMGLQAEQRFVVSSQNYRQARTTLDRIILRLRMYVEYPLRLAYSCAIDRYQSIYVITTNTFYAPLIARLFSSRRQLVVHLVWDLFPDALIYHGRYSHNSWIIGCVKSIVQKTLCSVDANVFLGQRLLKHAEKRFKQVPKSFVIPVGANASVFADVKIPLLEKTSIVDILYCGNFGSMHDNITIINAFKSSKYNQIMSHGFTLTFNASGTSYEDFKKSIQSLNGNLKKNIHFGSSLSDSEWVKRMHQAQIALVTMKPGSEKVVMPSKTYSALAAGQAILAICPFDSDLAQLVIEEKCGWVVTPGSHDELLAVLHEISTQPNIITIKRKNAFKVGQTKYSNVGVAHEWVKLLNNLK
jgi:glycosyltransferase involved in cell wall biosynthesis